jgi:Na+/H+ antiporter NhaC
MEDNSLLILYGIVYFLAVAFYIVFFVWANNNSPTGNSNNNWNDIKSNVFMSWIAPVIAILFSFISLFYLVRYPDFSVFVIMGLACLAVGLSVASLSFALVSR